MHRSSTVSMGIVTKVIYSLSAICLVCTLSLAAHRIAFGPAPQPDEDVVQSAAQPALPATASSRAGQPDALNESSPAEWRIAGLGDRSAIQRNDGSAPTTEATTHVHSGGDQGAVTGSSRALSTLTDTAPVLAGDSRPSASATVPVLLSAPAQSKGAAPAAPSKGGRLKDVFFGTNEGSACQPGERQFGLNDVPDLYVCVVLGGLTGKHVAQVTFLLPDGHVYQTMTAPFMTIDTPATTDPMVEVEGRRLEAKRAGWGANGDVMVTLPLPVAGTFITQYSLAGLWTVRVAVDGMTI